MKTSLTSTTYSPLAVALECYSVLQFVEDMLLGMGMKSECNEITEYLDSLAVVELGDDDDTEHPEIKEENNDDT